MKPVLRLVEDALREADQIDAWLTTLGITRKQVERFAAQVRLSSGWKLLGTWSDDHLPCCRFRASDGRCYELSWSNASVIACISHAEAPRSRTVLRQLMRAIGLLNNPPPGAANEGGCEVGDLSVEIADLESGSVAVSTPYGVLQKSDRQQPADPPLPDADVPDAD
jgi:hypothetical protein